MARTMDEWQLIERSIQKKYRKTLWSPFTAALERYELIQPGDRIAVCVSGGKDSMLLALMMRMLQRFTRVPYTCLALVMDPGYSPANRARIVENAGRLNLPIEIFETDIFGAAEQAEANPCYLCARMRRGHLYAKARELGCNKIALGHHFSDVIETTVMAMFYSAQLQAMPPKLHSTNFPGMQLIRPLYLLHEDDIRAWARTNRLEFLQCACRFTEESAREPVYSKRQEVKELIRALKKTNPDIEKSIFSSIHSVCLDTFPGWKTAGQQHTLLERF